ncbi:uncharacterized protein [Dysidea avara]|uniref:uncharacterized protein isoform X2 n=1 Tax=Dysidea avara TaxID=196820 RepID=UPI00331D6D3D
MQSSRQSAQKQTKKEELESSRREAKQMARKWKRSSSLVMLELAHSEDSNKDELVIINECYNAAGSDPKPSKLRVVDSRLAVYGTIRAKQDEETKDIEIVVQTGPPDPSDKSYQFNCHLYHESDATSSTKPPSYILFESLLYKNFFISWDLKNKTAKCEQLSLAPDTVIDNLCSKIYDAMIQRFVWVIPVDDREIEQFALKAYGESHFLAFKKNGDAILVQGAEINEEVTIFKIRYQ